MSGFTQADIDNLERALATGALSVRVAGREVTYRSTEEITAALSYMRGQLAGTAGPRFQLANFSQSDR